jgi:isocitrate dehydrogenase
MYIYPHIYTHIIIQKANKQNCYKSTEWISKKSGNERKKETLRKRTNNRIQNKSKVQIQVPETRLGGKVLT